MVVEQAIIQIFERPPVPTYSYACKACGHAFDIRQSFTDDSLTMCPECGELSLRKVLHPVGIAFKGSGFYRNDSKVSATAPSKKESSDSTTAKESTSGSTGSSDSGSSGSSGSSGDSKSSSVAAASSTSS
jgi:putative FmdB family regulatory protein